jgi:Cu/Ag efflux protein CusF
MKERYARALALGSALALGVAACASTHEKKTAAPAAPSAQAAPAAPITGKIAEGLVNVTATVEKIDLKKRLVTLRGPDGKLVTVTADERVKNLPQVKKGDEVVIAYYESLAYEVLKPGEATPGTDVAAAGAAAEPGEKPAGLAAREVTLTTTIAAIDMQAPSVTLASADGELVTVKVRDPAKLERVKVGDLVQITYAQALAISVEPAPKKTTK